MLKRYLASIFSTNRYPKIILQRDIMPSGLRFEVTNEIEEWRVTSMDDEQEFMKELIQSLNPEDILYDIGSCIGLYSIHAAGYCRLVYAFEPDPGFQKRIARNIRLNHIKNITTLPLAVSDKAGEVTLYTDGVGGRSPSLENLGQKNIVGVPCNSLDKLIEEKKILPPSVIKMDIEGAEFLALSGAKDLLCSKHRPRLIFLEVHPQFLEQFGHTSQDLEKFLEEHGYHARQKTLRDIQYHVIFEC